MLKFHQPPQKIIFYYFQHTYTENFVKFSDLPDCSTLHDFGSFALILKLRHFSKELNYMKSFKNQFLPANNMKKNLSCRYQVCRDKIFEIEFQIVSILCSNCVVHLWTQWSKSKLAFQILACPRKSSEQPASISSRFSNLSPGPHSPL